MRDIKLPQVGLEAARLLTTNHKFVCFNITSRVDIDCARSFLCQAPFRESIGTEMRGLSVRVPRETDFISRIEKTQHNIECHIYMYKINYHQVERKHSFLAITLYFFFFLSFRTSLITEQCNTNSVGIILFCDQGCKSVGLEERRNTM